MIQFFQPEIIKYRKLITIDINNKQEDFILLVDDENQENKLFYSLDTYYTHLEEIHISDIELRFIIDLSDEHNCDDDFYLRDSQRRELTEILTKIYNFQIKQLED